MLKRRTEVLMAAGPPASSMGGCGFGSKDAPPREPEDVWAIAPQFDSAWGFSEGLALVEVGGKRGYVDKTGKYAISPQFDSASPFTEGLAPVRVGGKWGFVRK